MPVVLAALEPTPSTNHITARLTAIPATTTEEAVMSVKRPGAKQSRMEETVRQVVKNSEKSEILRLVRSRPRRLQPPAEGLTIGEPQDVDAYWRWHILQ